MKVILILLLLLILAGCWGYSARDGDLTGQAKKLTHVTPLICPDYEALDVSLGIMKGGTGSMSTQDQWLTIASNVDTKALQKSSD